MKMQFNVGGKDEITMYRNVHVTSKVEYEW